MRLRRIPFRRPHTGAQQLRHVGRPPPAASRLREVAEHARQPRQRLTTGHVSRSSRSYVRRFINRLVSAATVPVIFHPGRPGLPQCRQLRLQLEALPLVRRLFFQGGPVVVPPAHQIHVPLHQSPVHRPTVADRFLLGIPPTDLRQTPPPRSNQKRSPRPRSESRPRPPAVSFYSVSPQ